MKVSVAAGAPQRLPGLIPTPRDRGGRLPDVTVDVYQLLEELRAARSSGRPHHEPLWRIQDPPEVVEALRTVREHGPGRLRAVALDALVYLGGPAALDPADVAAIERLIRIRRRTDPLGAVMSCWTYWWCIRTDEQAAVVASLGLTDARPVTFNLACSIIDILEHDERDSGIVYVGPAINGWTPVVGPRCDAFGERRADVQATLERLSGQYGETHAFYFGAQGDGSAWLVARDGATVRRYSSVDRDQCTGEPLPIEHEWMAAHDVPGRPEDHLTFDNEFSDAMWEFLEANDVAAAISLDVGWRHPRDVQPHGDPFIACLPGVDPAPLPPGAYEI